MLEIGHLNEGDHEAWRRLAQGYNDFYETVCPDEAYQRAWRRLRAGVDVHALGARLEGRLIGIAHYLFHVNVWRPDVCYLQDLFVDEAVRGLEAVLARMHREGRIFHGMFVSDRSIMTCAMHAGSQREVHFIDAADGGYALAAKKLKEQVAAARA